VDNRVVFFDGTTGKLIKDSGLTLSPAALTKIDDTNVTLTLGGTPTTSLLAATSLTLGWAGQLSTSRGGTGLSALGTSNQLIRVNSGATALEYFTPSYIATAVTSVATAGLISGGTITGTGTITTSMSTGKLVGRSTAGAGIMEEIAIGTGLTLSSGILSNSATYTSPLTTKGDIFVRSTVDTRLPVGTDGQILTANNSVVEGLSWQDNYADWTSVVKHTVKNNGLSGTITKGTAIYVTGSNGTNMLVGRASNTSEATSSKTMGLMQSDITTTGGTQTGFVVTEGLLGGLNTAGTTAGDPVWLGVSGALIYGLINKPYAPAHLVFIGIVTKVGAGSGEIFVKVQNGFELKEIHDVDIITTTPINGHILGFDGTLWVNKTIAGWLGFTPGTVTSVTGTTPIVSSGGTAPAISIPAATTSVNGYLSSTDWSTFNNKQAALSGTGFVKISGTAISYDSSTYLTTISGIAAGGELSGTYANPSLVNSAVIAKVLTGVNITGGTISATDSILIAFGKVQNQINGLIGGSIYKGTWNANTNTPALASGVGVAGNYYIVSVAGTTNLNGITDWNIGDWAIFNGGVWQKVDNTDAVVSVNGFTGAVSLTTSNIAEGSNLYFTNVRAISAILTGYVSGPGTISATDTILTAIQKLNGNIGSIVSGVSSVFGRTGAVVSVSGDYTTSQVTEGTNLYYTDVRARSSNSFVAGSGAYDSTTGVITIPTNNNQITNGSNFITLASLSGSTGISYNNTTGVISSTITQYTDALARSAISLNTTGTSGAATYSSVTGVLNIPEYTLTGLGGQPLATNLTSLSGLSYASTSFVKMTGTGVFALDTNTYITGNQSITLSGDVSGTGSIAITTTIGTGVVSLAKMANLAAHTIIGNNTGTSATPLALSGTQVTAMLDTFNGSTKGLVPVPSGPGTNVFLAADGNWLKIATSAIADQSGKTLLANTTGSAGAVSAVAISSITTELTAVVGDSGSGGTKGLVPAPASGDASAGKFLKADGLWAVPTTTIGTNVVTNSMLAQVATAIFKGRTTAGTGNVEDLTVTQATAMLNLFSTAATTKGLVPGSNGVANTNFLRADGTWAVPAGGGGGGGTTTNPFIIKADSGTTEGTDLYTFDGSSAKTINIVAGTNITITKTAGTLTISSTGGSSDNPVTLMTAFLNYT
jgi:hypothetical protein